MTYKNDLQIYFEINILTNIGTLLFFFLRECDMESPIPMILTAHHFRFQG